MREEVGQRDAPTSFFILQGEKREENLRKFKEMNNYCYIFAYLCNTEQIISFSQHISLVRELKV